MSKRGIVALVVLLAVGGLAAYDWWAGRRRAAREAEEKKVFRFEADEVSTVRLIRTGEEIRLHRTPEGWALQAPVAAAADTTAVDDLVSALVRSTIEKRLGVADDLSAYGLSGEAPAVEVIAGEGESERRLRVRIGGDHPFTRDIYTQIGDDPEVVLVSSGIGQAREKELIDLRDKQLITLQSWQMKSLQIEGQDRSVDLIRDRGEWILESPVRTPADDGSIADLISHLGRLEALAFAADDPDDLAPYGLDAPRLRVTLLQDDWAEPHRIDFGAESPDGNLYVRRWDRPAVLEVEASIWPKLNRPLEEIRSDEIFQVSRWTIVELDLEDAAGALRLAKDDDAGEWRIAGEDRPVDGVAVEELLDALEDLTASEFIDAPGDDLAPYGLQDPRLRLTARTEEDLEAGEGESPATPYVLFAGAEEEGEVFVKLEAWPSVFKVPADQIRQVEERIAAVRAPAAEPVDPEGVAGEGPDPEEAGGAPDG